MSDKSLDQLYPWQTASAATTGQSLQGSVQAKLAASQRCQQQFFDTQSEALIAAAQALAQCFMRGGRLFSMGNGGSACDAAHIAVEFNHPVTPGRPALPCINLAADTAMLTAVANDVGAEQIFSRQLISQARPGDALIGVSTSGNSANLLAAYSCAARQQLLTIGLSGAGGGDMAQSPDLRHCLTVPGDSVHRVQETQLMIYHMLWDLVHSFLEQSS